MDLLREMDAAVANLLGKRLVTRWRAANDRGDPGMTELEAIVTGDGTGFGGKSEFVKDRIHKIAGAIAGEGAAGAVGSVSTWSKPQD